MLVQGLTFIFRPGPGFCKALRRLHHGRGPVAGITFIKLEVQMDRGAGVREVGPTSSDAALVEAARGAPAALYQFRLSPSGTFGLPFVSPDFAARYLLEQGEPGETAARFFSRIHPDLSLIHI